MTSILDIMFSSTEKCGRTKFSDRAAFIEQYPSQTVNEQNELPQETKLHASDDSCK